MKPLTYVAVDKSAIAHNLRQVRALLAPGTALMAVVKANGYGHGLEIAAQAAAEAGADWLGASALEEAVALRASGLRLPILVFLPFLPEQAPEFLEHRLSATVVNEDGLLALGRATEGSRERIHFHLYVDGGLGRPGVGKDLIRLVELAAGFPELALDGVYTHMDAARPALSGLEALRPGADFRLFAASVREIASRLLGRRVLVHAAASALTLLQPEARLDLVRIGTLLYGQYPASVPAGQRTLDLRETMELRSTIVAVETLPRGTTVGYGAQHRCRRETRVGLLPVGYAQGLATLPADLARRRYGSLRGIARRLLRGAELPQAIVGGRPVPVLGRIAMDWCCLDLTDVPEAGPGTEVVLPCRRLMVDGRVPRLVREQP